MIKDLGGNGLRLIGHAAQSMGLWHAIIVLHLSDRRHGRCHAVLVRRPIAT